MEPTNIESSKTIFGPNDNEREAPAILKQIKMYLKKYSKILVKKQLVLTNNHKKTKTKQNLEFFYPK